MHAGMNTNFVGSHLEMRDLFLNNSKSAHLVAVASPGGLKNVTTCKCTARPFLWIESATLNSKTNPTDAPKDSWSATFWESVENQSSTPESVRKDYMKLLDSLQTHETWQVY